MNRRLWMWQGTEDVGGVDGGKGAVEMMEIQHSCVKLSEKLHRNEVGHSWRGLGSWRPAFGRDCGTPVFPTSCFKVWALLSTSPFVVTDWSSPRCHSLGALIILFGSSALLAVSSTRNANHFTSVLSSSHDSLDGAWAEFTNSPPLLILEDLSQPFALFYPPQFFHAASFWVVSSLISFLPSRSCGQSAHLYLDPSISALVRMLPRIFFHFSELGMVWFTHICFPIFL